MESLLKNLNLNEKALCYAVFTENEDMSRLARELEFKKENTTEFAANRKILKLIKSDNEGFILHNIVVIYTLIKNLESSFELHESILHNVIDEMGLGNLRMPLKERKGIMFQILKLEPSKEQEIKEMLRDSIEEELFTEDDLDELDLYVEYYYYLLLHKILFEREQEFNIETIRQNPTKLIVKLDDEMYRNLEIIRLAYSNPISTPGNTDIIKYLLKNHILELEKENESLLITASKLVTERIGQK